jgi:hypothetical protein
MKHLPLNRGRLSLAGELLLAAETYVWGLQGICQLHRIPFAPNLVLQQFPPPYDLLSLQRAATALGLKSGLRDVSVAECCELAVPFVAVLRPAASPNVSPEGKSASEPDTPLPCGLAIVIKCQGGQIAYFTQGRQHPLTATLDEFGAQFTGKVMLSVPSAPELKQADTTSENPERFGFRWFVPELLRHRAIWRDVLLASLAIQLMALATPVFTQVVIDKVIVHHTASTLVVIGIALGVFIIFTAVMSWVRQYLVLHTGNRIDAVLGSQVFEHLFKLPPRYFEHRPTGVLVARVHGVETVVAPGTIILTLVPHDEPLIAEVWVSNIDSGFVQEKQAARVKLAAYPFQKYGMLDGVVNQVGADAQEKSEATNSATKSMQETAYRALIKLNRAHLEIQGQRLKLVPGMQVNAEIHLGTRSVIEYLLSPVQKVVHEAGRER